MRHLDLAPWQDRDEALDARFDDTMDAETSTRPVPPEIAAAVRRAGIEAERLRAEQAAWKRP